jgi:hAT family C-terminal dimerisation region
MKPDGIDILGYWKRNEITYPTLIMIARDIFTVHVSIVPSESYFSSANMILTDKHSRLGAKTFERLVCLKDWFDAE